MPQTIFFEHKRANMSVFKERDGLYQSHHFEVDQNNRSVKLWAHWLTKDALIFSGSYAFTNQEMTLDGTIYDLGHCILRLHRRTAQQMSQASLIP